MLGVAVCVGVRVGVTVFVGVFVNVIVGVILVVTVFVGVAKNDVAEKDNLSPASVLPYVTSLI